jgi:xylulokinase
MVRAAVLGIDLGTSQLKAMVRGADGRVLGRGRAGYQVSVSSGEGQAETDPREWWRAAREAVGEALAEARLSGGCGMGEGEGAEDGDGIGAVGVTGQMHGVVLAAADGTPLRPAVVWLDRRATAEAGEYGRLPDRLTRPLGNAVSSGMAGPILRWLATHEPTTVGDAYWALQPKDWLRLWLTGQAATDPSDASGTLLFDQETGTWATDLIRELGIPGRLLPDIRDPASVAPLLPAAAEDLGLRPGIPVAVGAADTAASLYAARLPADAALLTLGTGGQWIAPTAAIRPAPNLNLFATANGGHYHLAAALNVGAALRWVTAILGASYDELYAAATRPWRADTPVFLPYLTAEREDDTTRRGGTWAGLTLGHDRDDMLRAALEGVAFALRDRLDDLRAAGHDCDRVLIGGGGARDRAWRGMLADVFGVPLEYTEGAEWLSVTGAAMLAEKGVGWGDGNIRPGDEGTETTRPRHPAAAGAGRERFSAHKSAMAGIGVLGS